jgi:hypothetical protein
MRLWPRGDAVDRREVGPDGHDPHRRPEEIEQGADDQDEEPLAPLHEPDPAVHPHRLGPGPRVAHHDRADEGEERDGHVGEPTPAREEEADPREHEQIRVAVEDRVEERAEG